MISRPRISWARHATAMVAASVVAACLVAAPASAATTSAVSVPTQSLGFADTVWGNPDISQDQSLAAFADAHATYWRTPMNWQYYEPTEGAYSYYYLNYLYQEYSRMRANGQTPIFDVLGTPYWALTAEGRGTTKGDYACRDNANATTCFAPPDVRNAEIDQHWRTFLAIAAYIMPDAVFEIWNEPNIDWFWMQPQDPQLYGQMLKSAGEAIHGASPSTRVISAGVNNYTGSDSSEDTDYRSFLKQALPVAGKAAIDGIGFHTYPCNQVPTAKGWTTQLNTDIAAVRAARDATADRGMPLWLTESGVTSSVAGSWGNCGTVFTEAQQGPALAAMLDWAKTQNTTKKDLPVVLVNMLFDDRPRDDLAVPNWDPQSEYGLIAYHRDAATGTITFAKKPAYAKVVCKFARTC